MQYKLLLMTIKTQFLKTSFFLKLTFVKNFKLIFLFLLPLPFYAQEDIERLALIIGNSNYKAGVLKNPVNDAKLFKSTMLDVGFSEDNILYHQNLPTKDSMFIAIKDFAQRLDSVDECIIYYAGHGIQAHGVNYLIPTNVNLRDEDDVDHYCYSFNKIMKYLSDHKDLVSIIILDACRNNPYESNWAGRSYGSKGLANIESPDGCIIGFSTKSGTIASDNSRYNNSFYTKALCENILKPNLEIKDVFQRTRIRVNELSEGRQTPVVSDQMMSYFYFLTEEDNSNLNLDEVYDLAEMYLKEDKDSMAYESYKLLELSLKGNVDANFNKLIDLYYKIGASCDTYSEAEKSYKKALTVLEKYADQIEDYQQQKFKLDYWLIEAMINNEDDKYSMDSLSKLYTTFNSAIAEKYYNSSKIDEDLSEIKVNFIKNSLIFKSDFYKYDIDKMSEILKQIQIALKEIDLIDTTLLTNFYKTHYELSSLTVNDYKYDLLAESYTLTSYLFEYYDDNFDNNLVNKEMKAQLNELEILGENKIKASTDFINFLDENNIEISFFDKNIILGDKAKYYQNVWAYYFNLNFEEKASIFLEKSIESRNRVIDYNKTFLKDSSNKSDAMRKIKFSFQNLFIIHTHSKKYFEGFKFFEEGLNYCEDFEDSISSYESVIKYMNYAADRLDNGMDLEIDFEFIDSVLYDKYLFIEKQLYRLPYESDEDYYAKKVLKQIDGYTDFLDDRELFDDLINVSNYHIDLLKNYDGFGSSHSIYSSIYDDLANTYYEIGNYDLALYFAEVGLENALDNLDYWTDPNLDELGTDELSWYWSHRQPEIFWEQISDCYLAKNDYEMVLNSNYEWEKHVLSNRKLFDKKFDEEYLKDRNLEGYLSYHGYLETVYVFLFENYFDIVNELFKNDMVDSAFFYINKWEEDLVQRKKNIEEYNAFNNRVLMYDELSDVATFYGELTDLIFAKAHLCQDISDTLNVYRHLDDLINYDRNTKYYYDNELYIDNIIERGDYYQKNLNPKKYIANYNLALAENKKFDVYNKLWEADILMDIGYCYEKMEDIENTTKYFNKAITIEEKELEKVEKSRDFDIDDWLDKIQDLSYKLSRHGSFLNDKATLDRSIGQRLMYLDTLDKYTELYNLRFDYSSDYMHAYYGIGDCYFESSDFNNAIEFYQKALNEVYNYDSSNYKQLMELQYEIVNNANNLGDKTLSNEYYALQYKNLKQWRGPQYQVDYQLKEKQSPLGTYEVLEFNIQTKHQTSFSMNFDMNGNGEVDKNLDKRYILTDEKILINYFFSTFNLQDVDSCYSAKDSSFSSYSEMVESTPTNENFDISWKIEIPVNEVKSPNSNKINFYIDFYHPNMLDFVIDKKYRKDTYPLKAYASNFSKSIVIHFD